MKMTSAFLLALLAGMTTCADDSAAGSVVFMLRPCARTCRVPGSGGVEGIAYRAGETVIASNADTGVSVTLVSDAGESGLLDWTPSSSGYWDLVNPRYGSVEFLAGTDDFGFIGDGTAESPLLVQEAGDVTEFLDVASVADDFVVKVSERFGIGRVDPVGGKAFVDLGGGMYRVSDPESDEVFRSASVAFTCDVELPGPNRKLPVVGSAVGIAYSGDNWTGDPAVESVLTITSPSGAVVTEALAGTGIYGFLPDEKGRWSVELVSPSAVLSGFLRVGRTGSQIVVR